MGNDFCLPCRGMPDIASCYAAADHLVPTVEFVLREFEAPLSSDDVDYLSQDEINLFLSDSQQEAIASQSRNKTIKSNSLTLTTLKFDTDFLLMGLCVYAYGEPMSTVLEGNQYGPKSLFDTASVAGASLPASPMNMRNVAALTSALWVDNAATLSRWQEPAQLEWGGPVWRAIWAFMYSRRLTMECPNSSYVTLIDELLADVGNCCSQINFEGFSTTKAGGHRLARRVNDRLHDITLASSVESGYFVPVNCEQDADATITPQRAVADVAAYGRTIAAPAVEQWFRLPCPVPFPVGKSLPIKITLTKANGDQEYLDRMIEELSLARNLSPINGIPVTFPLNEAEDGGRLAAAGLGGMTTVPGGKWRIGIGLKGFQVRHEVCSGLLDAMKNNDQSLMGQLMSGVAPAPGRVSTPFSGPGACIPCGVGTPENR